MKHSILLPTVSPFIMYFIRYLYRKHLYIGAQALMAMLLQRFWLVNAWKTVRSVACKCILCFQTPRRNNSSWRICLKAVGLSRPFTISGVDFCGPEMITAKLRGIHLMKAYVTVFVCFATKALHLEVVSDLTSKAFIATLKRFVWQIILR